MLQFSERAKGMKASDIREILKMSSQPGMISFAGGLPSPDSFPVKIIERLTDKVLRQGTQPLQYGPTEGVTELRKELVKRMRKKGIKCSMENLITTTGSQQAIDLFTKILLNPRDFIVLEKPSYLGAICTFVEYEARYIAVDLDESGMVMEDLEKKLKKHKQRKRIKFIYVVPTYQNPTGVTIPKQRRKHLLEITEKYHIPILEDDPYSELYYGSKPVKPIKSMDKSGLVAYTSTFSKILSPGFRLGWVVGEQDLVKKMVIAKQGVDLSSSIFVQYIAYEYLYSGMVDKHIPKIRKMYKRKRDIMLAALEKHFPKQAEWTKPDGGMFLWVTLPKKIDTDKLFYDAVKHKVAFVKGQSFFVDGSGHNTMRLNFSNADNDKIEQGIKRLARAIKKRL